MNIILLVLAVILLGNTIKGMPIVFSNKKLKDSLDEMKKVSCDIKNTYDWSEEGVKTFISILAKFLYLVFIIFYSVFGTYIKEPIIVYLTVVNLIQVLLIDIPTSQISIDSNFERYGKLYSNIFYRVLNLIINISYYGLIIYYLIIMIMG